MLVNLTPDERRALAEKYRQTFPAATFYEQVPSQNGQPFRLDDRVLFYKHPHPDWEEGIIGLLMSNTDEQLGLQTFIVILQDDERHGRHLYRVLVSDVSHSTS